MLFDDVMINKIQSIQRCIFRAKEEYQLAGNAFENDFSRQDAAILNITRACEQTIDLADYLIKGSDQKQEILFGYFRFIFSKL